MSDGGGNVERVEGLRATAVRSRGREDGERRREDCVGRRARARGATQAEVDGQERFNLLSLSTSACARSLLIRSFVHFVRATASVPRTKIGNAAVFSPSRERVQRRRRVAGPPRLDPHLRPRILR